MSQSFVPVTIEIRLGRYGVGGEVEVGNIVRFGCIKVYEGSP